MAPPCWAEQSDVVSKEEGEETAAKSKQRVQTLRIERMSTDGSLFE